MVELITMTENPVELIAKACKITHTQPREMPDEYYLWLLFELGHHSVFEHVNLTFRIECSRACAQQLTRHRLSSFCMKSQRNINELSFEYFLPPSVAESQDRIDDYKAAMARIQSAYRELMGLGVSREDARYILPNACQTEIYMTVNLRELMHMCSVRLCSRAQEEIRTLFEEIVLLVPSPLKFLLIPECHERHCFACNKNIATTKRREQIHNKIEELMNRE